jgi:hypothetical protein
MLSHLDRSAQAARRARRSVLRHSPTCTTLKGDLSYRRNLLPGPRFLSLPLDGKAALLTDQFRFCKFMAKKMTQLKESPKHQGLSHKERMSLVGQEWRVRMP